MTFARRVNFIALRQSPTGQGRARRLGNFPNMTWHRLSPIVVLCLLSASALAEPPLLRLAPAGAKYELEAATPGVAGQTWLAGSVTVGSSEDAFLTLLAPDGSTLFEKRFGSGEASDKVTAVVATPKGEVLWAGHLTATLPQGWSAGAAVDWEQQAVLGLADSKGQLLRSLELHSEPPPENGDYAYEPRITIACLAVTPSGDLLAGGSWTGLFEGKVSRGGPLTSQAFMLRLSGELKILEMTALDGTSLEHLSVLPDRVLGAGLIAHRDMDSMAAPTGRAVAWDLTQFKELWRGDVQSNPKCLQLEGSTLLYSDNDRGSRTVDILSGKSEELPEGVMALASLNGRLLGTGYRGAREMSALSEVGGALLWSKDDRWKPVLRWGTSSGRDFMPYAFSDDQSVTLVGITDGDFGGSNLPGDDRWVWVRMKGLPTAEEAAVLGARLPGATRAELGRALQELTFLERPGYDHFVGFFPLRQGQPAALVTGEARGFDSWSLYRGDSANKALRELSTWRPATPPKAPMEPQIFPHLSGDVVTSRDLQWISPERGKGTVHWTRLASDGTIAKELTLPMERPVDCKSLAATGNGGSVWFGVEWNEEAKRRLLASAVAANGQTLWTCPYDEWRDYSEQEWLSSAALPERRTVALCRIEGNLAVQAFTAGGAPDWKADLGHRYGQTLGVVGEHLLVITSASDDGDDLAVEAFDFQGKEAWSFRPPLGASAEVCKIVDAGDETVLVGSLKQGERWRGFAGVFRKQGEGWQSRVLDVMPDLGLRDALWRDGQLWVGGELVRDYVTDVFWGRLTK